MVSPCKGLEDLEAFYVDYNLGGVSEEIDMCRTVVGRM